MPEETKNKEVRLTELALSLSYQFEAVIRVLETKGILSRDELLNEIKLIRKEQGTGT
jgi:hypothetical protein